MSMVKDLVDKLTVFSTTYLNEFLGSILFYPTTGTYGYVTSG